MITVTRCVVSRSSETINKKITTGNIEVSNRGNAKFISKANSLTNAGSQEMIITEMKFDLKIDF